MDQYVQLTRKSGLRISSAICILQSDHGVVLAVVIADLGPDLDPEEVMVSEVMAIMAMAVVAMALGATVVVDMGVE